MHFQNRFEMFQVEYVRVTEDISIPKQRRKQEVKPYH